MKSKILLVVMLLSNLSIISLAASEEPEVPKWIEVSYADLEHNYVSEYQLVTITVTEKNPWWTSAEHQVEVEYDENQLQLVNTVSIDTMQNVEKEVMSNVNTSASSFQVSYQFYLQDGVELTEIPVTINKLTDGEISQTATINLATHSEKAPTVVEFGDIKLESSVTEYVNDGTTITFNNHFKVIENPNNQPFTLSLKPNNMKVTDTDSYDVKVRFSDGTAEAIDKNNFKLNMSSGDQFDLYITAPIAGLDAKDDRFEFFIYFQADDSFIRLEPTFFRSELIQASTNTRSYRYLMIKLAIAIFFGLLAIMFIVINLYRIKKKD